MYDKTIGELYAYVGLKSQSAAMCIASIAINSKDGSKKTVLLNDFKAKLTQPGNEVQASLCLGELGKLLDLSSVANIIQQVSGMFKAPDEAVRTAASICLGNLSVGNPNFFLEKVFALVDAAEHHTKYLFLNTIREIIVHNPRCLAPFISKLLPLLLEQSRNQDEQIRGIVAENLGRLFIYYSNNMSTQIENSFKSASPLERATVTKSFKFGAARETNSVDLELFVEFLIRLVGDGDITVRRCALESLTAIAHTQPHCVKADAPQMQNSAITMTKIDPSLIKEVDLGPFKHKIDDGIPIRKAAYGLIDTMIERLPERVDCSVVAEVAIRGLEDTAEECMIQCLSIIHRIV